MAKKRKPLVETQDNPEGEEELVVDAVSTAETSIAKTPKKKRKKAEADGNAILADPEVAETLEPLKKKKKGKLKRECQEDDVEAEQISKKEKKAKKAKDADDSKEPLEKEAEEHASTEWSGQVFIGGLPWAVEEDVLRKDFEECGEIEEVFLFTDKTTGQFKGFGTITFKSEDGVKAALAYNGTEYGGRNLTVRRDTKKHNSGAKGKSKGDTPIKTDLEVFISGLGPQTKEKALQKEFSKCGEIERLKMDVDIGDGGRCKGYAWITFVTQEGFEKAIERNGTEYKGHELRVEKSGEHKAKSVGKAGKAASPGVEVFIRGIPLATEESVVRKDFLECGEILKINMPRTNDSQCKGYAWITFANQDGADKAVEFNGDYYGGNKLLVEIAGQHKDRSGKGKGGKGTPSPGPKPAGCTTVVVKGLSYEATESDLKKLFAKSIDMRILTDRETGKSKGIAFVDFDSEKAVDDAMKLSGQKLKGRAIWMDYAAPRAD